MRAARRPSIHITDRGLVGRGDPLFELAQRKTASLPYPARVITISFALIPLIQPRLRPRRSQRDLQRQVTCGEAVFEALGPFVGGKPHALLGAEAEAVARQRVVVAIDFGCCGGRGRVGGSYLLHAEVDVAQQSGAVLPYIPIIGGG